MADAATVANAYVQIIPSAQGVEKKLTEALSSEGGKAGEGFASKFGKALKGLGATMAKAAAAAGAAAVAAGVAITKMAVDSYAEYEQLTGGIETLYGDTADVVLANAQKAFETAGMSANDYMNTAMQFSGALLQSVGNDTVKAAQIADMAITDMSDNANKMGSDIENLQNAYRGFSRGNFTMLDNLALGYGGTREEMQRLLDDAMAIKAAQGEVAEYSIDSYADICDAIHVVQTEMGITGTTAKEAASTISGSWGMLRASWSNLLTSLAGGGDDIETSVKNVFDSLGAWLGNLLPRIVETVRGILAAIPVVAQEAMAALPGLILDIVEQSFGTDARERVLDFINTIHGIVTRVQEFGAGLMEALTPLTDFLTGNGPAFEGMMERIRGHLADLQPHLLKLKELWDNFKQAFTGLVEAVAPIAAEFFGNLASAIVGLLPIVASIAEKFVAVATTVINAVTGILKNAKPTLNKIKETATKAFKTIYDTVSKIVGNVKSVVEKVWNGIKNIIETVGKLIDSIVSGDWNGVKSVISGIAGSLGGIVRGAWEGIKSVVSTVGEGIKSVASNAWNSMKSAAETTWNTMKSTASTVWNGIKTTAGTVWEGIKKAVSDPIGTLKKTASDAWESMRTTAQQKWEAIKGFITNPLESARSTAQTALSKMQGYINGLTGKTVEVGVKDTNSQSVISTLQGRINGLTGKTVDVNVRKTGISGIDINSKAAGGGWYMTTYAAGGIATKPTAGIFGEAGDEALIPLSNRDKVRPFAQAVAREMGAMRSTGVTVTGNTFVVRNDADIPRIAREIGSYTSRQMAGRL